MRLHMRGQRLWDVLSGELPCPLCPIAPTMPSLASQATDDDRAKAKEQFDDAMENYQSQFALYKAWLDEDARASAILVASMEIHLTGEEQSLQQGDSTVDEFYTQLSSIWRQLDSLGPTICHTCQCCQRQRSHMDLRRIYDFLTRLRSEYESTRAQLLARHPRVTIMEALTEIRSEDIRLRELCHLVGVTFTAPIMIKMDMWSHFASGRRIYVVAILRRVLVVLLRRVLEVQIYCFCCDRFCWFCGSTFCIVWFCCSWFFIFY
ncbi:hypothetical protein DAI22_02g181700 [Oryza sativa Japonica Group]|nr:hypothetical protein DAI22_02g181700 [Oryza sativa Japonica Group]